MLFRSYYQILHLKPHSLHIDNPSSSFIRTIDARDYPWDEYDIIVNAAAWTDVDGAESPEGRRLSWRANATGPANLARAASQHNLTLVHISSEYTFDGSTAIHTEDEPPSPLGVYGQSKAGGDAAVMGTPRHYLVRTRPRFSPSGRQKYHSSLTVE